jgi:hypothetical protein
MTGRGSIPDIGIATSNRHGSDKLRRAWGWMRLKIDSGVSLHGELIIFSEEYHLHVK